MSGRRYNRKHASPEVQLACYEAIVRLAGAGQAWPTLGSIGQAAGVAKSTAARAVRDLELAGWIERRIVITGGPGA